MGIRTASEDLFSAQGTANRIPVHLVVCRPRSRVLGEVQPGTRYTQPATHSKWNSKPQDSQKQSIDRLGVGRLEVSYAHRGPLSPPGRTRLGTPLSDFWTRAGDRRI